MAGFDRSNVHKRLDDREIIRLLSLGNSSVIPFNVIKEVKYLLYCATCESVLNLQLLARYSIASLSLVCFKIYLSRSRYHMITSPIRIPITAFGPMPNVGETTMHVTAHMPRSNIQPTGKPEAPAGEPFTRTGSETMCQYGTKRPHPRSCPEFEAQHIREFGLTVPNEYECISDTSLTCLLASSSVRSCRWV